MPTNLTLNSEDTRLILNWSLIVCPDGLGFQLRSKSDTCLGDSIDSKNIVEKLCSSEKTSSYESLPHIYMQSIGTYSYT